MAGGQVFSVPDPDLAYEIQYRAIYNSIE